MSGAGAPFLPRFLRQKWGFLKSSKGAVFGLVEGHGFSSEPALSEQSESKAPHAPNKIRSSQFAEKLTIRIRPSLHRLRKNSKGMQHRRRAALRGPRKGSAINVGFSPCGRCFLRCRVFPQPLQRCRESRKTSIGFSRGAVPAWQGVFQNVQRLRTRTRTSECTRKEKAVKIFLDGLYRSINCYSIKRRFTASRKDTSRTRRVLSTSPHRPSRWRPSEPET